MSIINLFASSWSALSQWRRREQAYSELMALNDRELADIGVRRSEIPAIVEGVYDSDSDRGFDPGRQTAKLALRKIA
jgi:uncharacterized protein YjiS (DUF1127 family)